MIEHHRHNAVGLDDPTALGENCGHLALIVGERQGFGRIPLACASFEPGRAGDGFPAFVGQVDGEVIGENVAGGALEPNIEEVGQLRVVDVGFVGRVEDDAVH